MARQVAGADGVNEVIEKFSAQEETHATLAALSRESQTRIDLLLEQRTAAQTSLQEARYVGPPVVAPTAEELAALTSAVNGVDQREQRHEEQHGLEQHCQRQQRASAGGRAAVPSPPPLKCRRGLSYPVG